MRKYLVVLSLIIVLLIAGCSQKEIPLEKIKEEIKGMTTPTEEAEEIQEIEEKGEMIAGDISILGRDGFDPATEITIKEGDSLVFINNDPQQQKVVVIIQKSGYTKNSPQIKFGESYEHVFKEAGEYKFWTVNYGIKSKIMVK